MPKETILDGIRALTCFCIQNKTSNAFDSEASHNYFLCVILLTLCLRCEFNLETQFQSNISLIILKKVWKFTPDEPEQDSGEAQKMEQSTLYNVIGWFCLSKKKNRISRHFNLLFFEPLQSVRKKNYTHRRLILILTFFYEEEKMPRKKSRRSSFLDE